LAVRSLVRHEPVGRAARAVLEREPAVHLGPVPRFPDLPTPTARVVATHAARTDGLLEEGRRRRRQRAAASRTGLLDELVAREAIHRLARRVGAVEQRACEVPDVHAAPPAVSPCLPSQRAAPPGPARALARRRAPSARAPGAPR